MSKRFFELSKPEMLALDNEALNTAIRIEAIERGIQPPITLSESLRQSEWVGYQKPAEAMQVWEIQNERDYGGNEPSGVAYLTKEDAERAMQGMVTLIRKYDKTMSVKSGSPAIMMVNVGVSKSDQKGAAFEEFQQNTEDFDKVADECVNHVARIRQIDYNAKVRAEKKTEYLRLAGGDDRIARNFWAKAEGTPWDHDPEDPAKSDSVTAPVPEINDDIFN